MPPEGYREYLSRPDTQEEAARRTRDQASTAAAALRKRLGEFLTEYDDQIGFTEDASLREAMSVLRDISVRCGQ